MKRKLKLILHHDVTEHVTIEHKVSLTKFISKVFFGLVNFITQVAYSVGLILVSIPKLPKIIKREFSQYRVAFNFNKTLSFIILIIIAVSPIILSKTISEGRQLGGRVLGISQDAFDGISEAQTAISNQDYTLAQSNFSNALDHLKNAQTELDQSSLFLQSIVKLSPNSYNSAHVLEAAQLLTESAVLGSELLASINEVQFTPEGLSQAQDQNLKETLISLRTKSTKISENLSKANELIEPLNAEVLPAEYQSILKDSQSLVKDLAHQTESLGLVATVFTDLLLEEKRFLVVLQNNNELRATGGFIGTIGQGKISNGSIQKLDIRSVYDLDGQLKEWVTPPSPYLAVNNRLFLRDSNWQASFPESAQSLALAYERSGGETPDLIIALTPDLFLSLLEMTGPITLPTYGVTITPDNFIEQIQTTTSLAYDKNLNQPKQMLADLYPTLMQRISEITNGNSLLMLNILQSNLASKNILLYSRDESIQSQIEKFHWAGQINETDRDYLHINSSNLGGTKTDRLLSRDSKLVTTIDPDGSIINQLTYTVSNPLPNEKGLENRSFLRVFTPKGSRLLSSNGFKSLELDKLATDKEYIIDPTVEKWQGSLKFDGNTSTFTGEESGKSFFGGWVEVAGNSSTSVTLTYQLPFKLRVMDRYSLLWQKQSGMLPLNLKHDLIFNGRKILWDNLSSTVGDSSNRTESMISWNAKLENDKFIGLVLNKQN